MLDLKSQYFKFYYGNNPDYYKIAFMHYNLEIFDGEENEYRLVDSDLRKVKDYVKEMFKIYFSDINTFLSFINNSKILDNYFKDIYLRINSEKDLKKINQYKELSNLNIIVFYSDISNYKKSEINNYQIILQIDTVNELSPAELMKIKNEYNVTQIIVGQICYISSYYIPFFKRIGKKFNIDYREQLNIEKHALISNDNYTVEDYIRIYNELTKLISSIKLNDREIDRFRLIYDRIANKIFYDFDSVTKLNNQNLIGGLFNNLAVCEGYSKIMQQALSLALIKSIIVGGGGNKEDGGHIWNQVKIDGIWYNSDVTYGSVQAHKNEPFTLCLVDDNSLYYKTDYLSAKVCSNNYDFEKLR